MACRSYPWQDGRCSPGNHLVWLILELTGNVGTLVKLVGIVEETGLAHVVAGDTVVQLSNPPLMARLRSVETVWSLM